MIQRLTNYNTNLPAAGKYHELRMADVLYVSWFLSIVETLIQIKTQVNAEMKIFYTTKFVKICVISV